MSKNERNKFIIAGAIIIVVLAVLVLLCVINVAQAIEITILFALVSATFIYAKRTLEIAEATKEQAAATKKQAVASVEMADEMREQRIMASRPVIIQKAVYEEGGRTDLEIQWLDRERSASNYFSHFEVYNAGNGPAIEVGISLLDKEQSPLHSIRQTFLRADDPPIKFRPSNIANLEESKTYYLVCEYQSILSRETWYQTWLAFKPAKSSKEDKIFIVAGELEFREVTEKNRIDAFSSRRKPK